MIVDELKDFRNKLMRFILYRKRQIIEKENLTKKEQAEFKPLYDDISISAGKYAPLIKEYTGLEKITTSAGLQDVWNWAFNFEHNNLVLSALNDCLQATGRTIGKLEDDIKKNMRDREGKIIEKSHKVDTEPPKAFIAHAGDSPALRKLRSFLEALGVQCLIAEVEPSDGRLVEPQVTRAYEHANFAIILATKGGVIDKNKGVYYMAMNVADELGRAREIFKNRIIFLLETGVEPHTNISGIVYERFAPQSMDKAFIKIARELRNWGFIIAGKAKQGVLEGR